LNSNVPRSKVLLKDDQCNNHCTATHQLTSSTAPMSAPNFMSDSTTSA